MLLSSGCDDGGETIGGERLRPGRGPGRVADDTLHGTGDPFMVKGGIGNAGVPVGRDDTRASHPDGSDGRALVDAVGAVGEAGDDRRWIRRQGGVAAQNGPFALRAAVLGVGVGAAPLRNVAFDPRLVGRDDRSCGSAGGAGLQTGGGGLASPERLRDSPPRPCIGRPLSIWTSAPKRSRTLAGPDRRASVQPARAPPARGT